MFHNICQAEGCLIPYMNHKSKGHPTINIRWPSLLSDLNGTDGFPYLVDPSEQSQVLRRTANNG